MKKNTTKELTKDICNLKIKTMLYVCINFSANRSKILNRFSEVDLAAVLMFKICI